MSQVVGKLRCRINLKNLQVRTKFYWSWARGLSYSGLQEDNQKYSESSNRPFAYSQFDSKILCFYTSLIRLIYFTTGKMVPVLPRAMKGQRFWVLFSYNLYIFEPCEKSEDSFIVNRKLTICHKIFQMIMGNIHAIFV